LLFYDWVNGQDGPSPKPDNYTYNDDDALDDYIDKWQVDLKSKYSGKNNTKTFTVE